MDPFDFFIRRPVPVKASTTATDLDFDAGLIDRILGTPEKIDIPERYIPEEEPQLEPEEERKRSQKAEAICRLLSKSNGAVGIPLNPVRLPTAVNPNNPKANRLSFHHQQQQDTLEQSSRGSCNSYPRERSSYQSNQYPQYGGGGVKSLASGTVQSTPASPVKRSTSLRKPGSIPGSSSIGGGGSGGGGGGGSANSRHSFIHSAGSQKCDWSLAGVCPPKEVRTSNLSATERLFGNKRPPPPSVYGFGFQGSRDSAYLSDSGVGSRAQQYGTLSNLSSGNRRYTTSSGSGDIWKRNENSSRNTLQPNHSYNSSYSSSCSSGGRSSADREELLHLQQYLAKEVTEKSRLVAVRALASSPGPRHEFSHQRYRDPSPPSPVELPIVQQREGFFT